MPKEIMIVGWLWYIERKEMDDGGIIDYDNNTIYINEKYNDKEFAGTLAHEVAHIVADRFYRSVLLQITGEYEPKAIVDEIIATVSQITNDAVMDCMLGV